MTASHIGDTVLVTASAELWIADDSAYANHVNMRSVVEKVRSCIRDFDPLQQRPKPIDIVLKDG